MSAPLLLNHRAEGPPGAPALVLLGSLGSDLAIWDPQAVGLRDEWRVVRLDLPGHGGSPLPPEPCSVAAIGADLLATLDGLGVGVASFCGVSLGGSVAMWVAANASERVERLVVAFSSAHYGGSDAWLERAATVRAAGTAAVADAVLARWFSPRLAARSPETVARMRAMIAATPAAGYAACCEALATFDLRPELTRIDAPTLVVAGELDPATPVEHGELIAAAVPGARLELLPGVAHLGSYESPGPFNSLLREHLTRGGGG